MMNKFFNVSKKKKHESNFHSQVDVRLEQGKKKGGKMKKNKKEKKKLESFVYPNFPAVCSLSMEGIPRSEPNHEINHISKIYDKGERRKIGIRMGREREREIDRNRERDHER
jgi:hypothetical protein